MLSQMSDPMQGTKSLSCADAIDIVLAQQPDRDPFALWHLRRKFQVMGSLFRKYLTPDTKFADVACGTCDGLVLASLCQPRCEMWGLDIYRPSLDIAKQRT